MNQNKEGQLPMVQNISCIIPETAQLGALFLGNVYGAQNAQILKQYGIRAVITTSAETAISYNFEDIPFHFIFAGHDKDDYCISEHINDCIHFIEQNRKFTNVYVHCYAGVSRSSAIVCSYMMWKYRWNLNQTLSFLKFKRIVAKPNDGFMRQLIQVQAKLNLNKDKNNARVSNAQRILSPQMSREEEPISQKRPGSYQQIPLHIQKPQSPTLLQSQKLQPFAQLAQMQQSRAPQQQINRGEYGNNYPYKTEEVPLQDRSAYRKTSHHEVPIPKFYNRKSQYNKGAQQEDGSRKSINNDYMSPQMPPTSPRNKFGQKNSIGRMNSVGLGSPQRPLQDMKGYRDQQASVYSTNYSKKTYESNQTAKTMSRCLIRPKDLPGYKSGSKNY